MKKHLTSVLVLFIICAVVSVLLAVGNEITAPIIAEQLAAAANAGLLKVMPNGGTFEEVTDLSAYTLPATINKVYKASNGGHVFEVKATGYGGAFIIMCGVDATGTVTGAICLDKGGETLGKEATYGDNFTGKTLATLESVDLIGGATLTSGGYRTAIKDAINASTILGGGDVDIRTPEEILNDNLNAALGTEDVKFEKYFFVEDIKGFDAIYVAENNGGYVFVNDERFVGVDAEGVLIGGIDADGEPLTDITDDAKAAMTSAVETIKATVLTDVNLGGYTGISKLITSVKKTATGNYVIEVKGEGYGINGSYGASGEYIVIKLSVASNGTIIDCYTVSQKESTGIGTPCADEKFYGQFDGKNLSNYKNIDALSGATVTTDGYVQAIGRALNAVKIIEGGEQ